MKSMGCKKEKIGTVIKVAILLTILFSAFISPLSIADEDDIHVTFDPQGGINLDVAPETANFTAVTAGSTDNGPTEGAGDTDYTVWNNGSVAAIVYIYSNGTTDSGNMALDDDGAAIPADGYSLDITGSNSHQITQANASWIDPLAASGSVTFGIDLDLGSSLTQDWGYQHTTINVTAAVK